MKRVHEPARSLQASLRDVSRFCGRFLQNESAYGLNISVGYAGTSVNRACRLLNCCGVCWAWSRYAQCPWGFVAYVIQAEVRRNPRRGHLATSDQAPHAVKFLSTSLTYASTLDRSIGLVLFTMHISVIHGPMRTPALGARMSSATLAPFSYSTAASSLPSFQQTLRQQKRAASTVSRCQRVVPFNKKQLALLKLRPQQAQMFLTTALRNTCIRANSTSTSSSPTPSSSPKAGDVYLDWNSFFKLRASRRRYSLASSILSSIATTVVGVQILSTQDLENLGAQAMGLDPLVVLGLATAACGAVGWLVGPFLGNAIWGLIYRQYKPAVQVVRLLCALPYISYPHTPCSRYPVFTLTND